MQNDLFLKEEPANMSYLTDIQKPRPIGKTVFVKKTNQQNVKKHLSKYMVKG